LERRNQWAHFDAKRFQSCRQTFLINLCGTGLQASVLLLAGGCAISGGNFSSAGDHGRSSAAMSSDFRPVAMAGGLRYVQIFFRSVPLDFLVESFWILFSGSPVVAWAPPNWEPFLSGVGFGLHTVRKTALF